MLDAVEREGPALAEALPEGVFRQRVERRVLRLFIHALQCRELLSCLALQDPACRRALEWLSSLVLVAVDGPLVAMAARLVAEILMPSVRCWPRRRLRDRWSLRCSSVIRRGNGSCCWMCWSRWCSTSGLPLLPTGRTRLTVLIQPRSDP